MTNPFATRFTRPGVLASRDAGGEPVDVDGMLRRFDGLGGAAVIVGPHGSGKSTLLAHLAAAIERRGGPVARHRVRGWRDVPPLWGTLWRTPPGGVLCVDSWECLRPPARVLVRLAARLRGCRLLVTAHQPVGVPVLARCRPSLPLLHALVAELLGRAEACGGAEAVERAAIGPADIAAAFRNHGGDLRESLYELYDRFEASGHGPGVGGPVLTGMTIVPAAGGKFTNTTPVFLPQAHQTAS